MERKVTRRRILSLSAATLLFPTIARAQSAQWPTRPIRVIVPFGTGGGTDITMRLLAPRMSELLGQTVIVERGAEIARDGIALRRVGGTDDVAQLVLFLATSEPCFITGQDFTVDGFQYNI